MAKSKSKRHLEHRIRNGERDKSLSRGGMDIDFSTHVRVTPTKKDRLRKNFNKYKGKFDLE